VAAALISFWNGDDADGRGGQEAKGMGGLSRSRRDEDGGGGEKGCDSDGSALLTMWQGGG
jgi:hypothetical protein